MASLRDRAPALQLCTTIVAVPQELPQTGRILLHESLDRGVASAEQLHVLKALIYERRTPPDHVLCVVDPAVAAALAAPLSKVHFSIAFINSLTTLPQVYYGHREVVSSILGGGVEGL